MDFMVSSLLFSQLTIPHRKEILGVCVCVCVCVCMCVFVCVCVCVCVCV